jgi:hypothetical protein
MAVEWALAINFGKAGNGLAHLGDGWALPEPDFTWGIGAESHIVLPRLEEANEYVLTLDVVPFVHAPELPKQRLIVRVNNVVVGSSELSRPTLVGYRIRPAIIRSSDRVLVTLQHPDATRPTDFADAGDRRLLSFAIIEAKVHGITVPHRFVDNRLPPGLMLAPPDERVFGTYTPMEAPEWAMERTGMTLPQIAFKFESLGENCEFGLFQRHCDAEPMGLLRFSSTFMRNLIRGIDNRFEGLGAAEDIDPRPEGADRREYMIHEKKFGLVYHSFVYEGERSIWLMREQESARLKFLLRKFIEELEVSEKVFVYKRNVVVSEEEILPLHMALNRFGDNTLLWVVRAQPDRPAGTVEVVMPGLLKGYIDRFAPDDNAHDFSFDGWLRICANACVLARLRKPEPPLSEH